MATTVYLNGIPYIIPDTGETGWGQNVTNYLTAIAGGGLLQLEGGSFTLLNDVNFGPNFGLLSPYYKSGQALPADSGVLRLTNTETIAWRNSTDTADLVLELVGDQLTFNGVSINGTVTSVAASGSQGVTITGSPITSSGTIGIGLGDITPTSISTAGNLTFSSTAQRIRGDMSSSTIANRLSFQSTTTNGNTLVHTIPNGTSTNSGFIAENSSTPGNNAFQVNNISATQAQFLTGTRGTGTQLPLVLGSISGISMTSSNVTLTLDINRNVVIGPDSALATTATDGFLYLPTSAGTPTGVATSKTGKVAIEYDSTNNILYAYNSGWKAIPSGTSGVTPGSYTLSNITVDAYGRITAASNGSLGTTLTNITIGGVKETISTTSSVDFTSENISVFTLTGNTTIPAPTNAVSGKSCTVTYVITQNASSTVTWFSGIKWKGLSTPVMTPSAGFTDIYILTTFDGGSNWFGTASQGYI